MAAIPPSKLRDLLQQLGQDVEARVPEGWGFGIFIFEPETAPGLGSPNLFWVSNCARAAIVPALQEWIAKQGAS